MRKETTLEGYVERVLEELERTGYCQSTIHIFKKVYARLLKVAAIMQTDTLSCALADRFDDEIIRFFNVCDTLAPRKENRVRHLVLPMYFRLLYCCGVRTCEARLLLRKNVNLHAGYIDIIQSKGPKDRRVFLPKDLGSLYLKYDAVVNDIYPDRTYFFPTKADRCYECSAISQNFRKVWKASGFRIPARAYDFRYPNFNKIQTYLKKTGTQKIPLEKGLDFISLFHCLNTTEFYQSAFHVFPFFRYLSVVFIFKCCKGFGFLFGCNVQVYHCCLKLFMTEEE